MIRRHTTPNILTIFRGVATLAIVVVFLSPVPDKFMIGLALFVLAALSDYFDGFLARRWGATSDFGAMFDPLFDKLLVLTLILLIYPFGVVPAVVLLILFARDISIDMIKSFLLARGVVTPATYSAKVKTAMQMCMLGSALAALAWPSVPYLASAATTFGILAVIFSLWSGGLYVHNLIRFTKGEHASSSQ